MLIRDPYRFSDAMLIVPPALLECLALFDGHSTELDLRESLVRLTGSLEVGEIEKHLIDTLSSSGFLEDQQFVQIRQERQREFSEAPKRQPVHAGMAYPADAGDLRIAMERYMDHAGPAPAVRPGLCGISAPHVSPEGGWPCYRAAYRELAPEWKDRTFVVLGTSHYGEPERFGLTRKPFLTPFGEATVDLELVDRLAQNGGPAVKMEDYCHSIEHSIEFQVVFLQHVFGPDLKIVPVLCGPYFRCYQSGGRPEDDENVKRFLDALGEMAAREDGRLFWVLGIDMAHIGRRYGDPFAARANEGHMLQVAARDRERIERLVAGDAAGFWDLVAAKQDDLRWCGAAPLYTFMKAVPAARAELLEYQQWNIDPNSVVTFGGLALRA